MARSLIQAAATLSLLTSSALAGSVVKYNFNVANGNIKPDGVTRNAVLVNGRSPGPLITANKNDVLEIVVNNHLTNSTMHRSTTIHWHGLLQAHNAQDDGAAFVTQCPISPEASYTYRIPLNGQAGTYWYHSHLATQYVDGLRGPIVIYPKDPYGNQYDVDDASTVYTIADWYHKSAQAIEDSHNFKEFTPNSITINGKGRFDPLHMPASPDTLYTLKVKRGKRYRLRLINVSAIASVMFGVQGHNLTVIEMDGALTKPMVVDKLEVLAGQRYSVILHADQTPDTYWINAPGTNILNTTGQALLIYDGIEPSNTPKGPYWTSAISDAATNYWNSPRGHSRRYSIDAPRAVAEPGTGAEPKAMSGSEARSKTVPWTRLEKRVDVASVGGIVLDETKLEPLESPGACGVNEPVFNLTIGYTLNTTTGLRVINGNSYKPPNVPTLLQIMSGNTMFATTENTYTLPKNTCVEIHILGHTGLQINHPFHLHGHVFDVVQYGNATINLTNPPRRDVVGVFDEGVRIRFKTDNPGPWFLHCHIDWHLAEGLAAVMVEDTQDMVELIKPDPAWEDLCKKYNALPLDSQ
ncbi:Multicopper oxidase [Ceratobasidium sp. AG-Ba]|nr:Multicopper oxidase [Ceratobasidium sp. AG-Ba]